MASSGNDMELPTEVRELIRERINSIESLEVVVALCEAQGNTADLDELSVQLRLPPASIRTAVEELQSAGLAVLEGEQRARYQASSPELERSVRALVDCYASFRVEMLVFISQNAIGRVRKNALSTFAEAFKLQGRKK